MQISEQDQLVVASVDREEAAKQSWRQAETPVDIVRLTDSEELAETVLAELGFVARPCWVNWIAAAGGSEDEFVARMSATERRALRLGRRALQDDGLRVAVQVGLTAELMDEFLVVYDKQIAEMPRGRNFARSRRERLLGAADEYIAVSVYAGHVMVTGSIWWVRPEESVLQMRFSAAVADARSRGMMRVAYAEALRYARENGLASVSLGNDPSLFGHVVQPGLFTFKSRFGFAPVPAQALNPAFAGEYADMFLTLRALSDPALVVTWGRHRGTSPSWPEVAEAPGCDLLVLSSDPDEKLAAFYRTTACRETRMTAVPSGPALP